MKTLKLTLVSILLMMLDGSSPLIAKGERAHRAPEARHREEKEEKEEGEEALVVRDSSKRHREKQEEQNQQYDESEEMNNQNEENQDSNENTPMNFGSIASSFSQNSNMPEISEGNSDGISRKNLKHLFEGPKLDSNNKEKIKKLLKVVSALRNYKKEQGDNTTGDTLLD